MKLKKGKFVLRGIKVRLNLFFVLEEGPPSNLGECRGCYSLAPDEVVPDGLWECRRRVVSHLFNLTTKQRDCWGPPMLKHYEGVF